MIGDKLIIEKHHTDRASDLCEVIAARLSATNGKRLAVSIAGESGCGKSELASELARLLAARGIKTGILQQDDYFVFPPKTNHEMRRRNPEQVSPYEVKLDFLDSNLRSFKRGESPIYKPLVIMQEDRITTEEMEVGGLAVMIAEGTYTSLLRFADLHVFIARNYRETLKERKRRARDQLEPFVEEILEKEHRLISPHSSLAHVLIPADFSRIETHDI
jgi:uridine kinase